ncbi:Uma2 family endonuclease [Roseofilum capinflatum]|uniref:Uma2 family endonuclease n=1 Tax=Roseofilum capinflatum BLCC-M114 TaxID=3022440 RepID=A0ABT7BCJ9_9CYAN|nr:Uma2 family endonuclease [Roseofilum capinflatum]MDJ1176241.1 Uma2 family endonuclease [Roseofilum capinflatum BLCC-M114]
MVHLSLKPLTLAEFLELPETKPAREYIEGEIIQKPMPKGKHSVIQGELLFAINRRVKPQRIAQAFPELRCTFGDRSIVPDLCVFTWDRIPTDEEGQIADLFALAPDWTIEILSPDQSSTKVTKNILYCLKQGSQMGWLIDPQEQTLLVYTRKQEIEVYDRPDDRLPVPDFAAELELTIGDLFGWLRKT